MGATALRHKHSKLDQKKIDFAKPYFGVEFSKRPSIRHSLFSLRNNKFVPP